MTTALTPAAAPPSADELYRRLRSFLLQEANLLPQALPTNVQAAITFMAFGADDEVVSGFKKLVELAGDRAYEKGWMAHEMWSRRLLDAATSTPTPAERLTVVEGGHAS